MARILIEISRCIIDKIEYAQFTLEARVAFTLVLLPPSRGIHRISSPGIARQINSNLSFGESRLLGIVYGIFLNTDGHRGIFIQGAQIGGSTLALETPPQAANSTRRVLISSGCLARPLHLSLLQTLKSLLVRPGCPNHPHLDCSLLKFQSAQV